MACANIGKATKERITLNIRWRRSLNLFMTLGILLSLVLPCLTITTHAADDNVIRVGFPIQKGLTELEDDGSYTGYTVSYLEELSKYTGWEYEYVQIDGDINTQLTTLMNMLKTGEIDMMGAMTYQESLEEVYLYPNYSYGTSYVTLSVAKDSTNWMAEDYGNWDGIRIATYPGFERRLPNLEKFA